MCAVDYHYHGMPNSYWVDGKWIENSMLIFTCTIRVSCHETFMSKREKKERTRSIAPLPNNSWKSLFSHCEAYDLLEGVLVHLTFSVFLLPPSFTLTPPIHFPNFFLFSPQIQNDGMLKVRPGPQRKSAGFQAQIVCLTPWTNGTHPGQITALCINSNYGL